MLEYCPRSLVWPGRPPTTLGFGDTFSKVGFGAEYGTSCPELRRVIEIAKVDCSGFPVLEAGSLAGGTGIKEAIRDARD